MVKVSQDAANLPRCYIPSNYGLDCLDFMGNNVFRSDVGCLGSHGVGCL